jgi:hypothetical protein
MDGVRLQGTEGCAGRTSHEMLLGVDISRQTSTGRDCFLKYEVCIDLEWNN